MVCLLAIGEGYYPKQVDERILNGLQMQLSKDQSSGRVFERFEDLEKSGRCWANINL